MLWLGGSVRRPTSGHDLTVCGFEPCVRLCADCLDPGACFGFCVSHYLCPSPAHAPSLCLSVSVSLLKINTGVPGWLSCLSVRLQLRSHNLRACECEPCIWLFGGSSQPAARFGFSLPLSLPLPHSHFVSLKNKH